MPRMVHRDSDAIAAHRREVAYRLVLAMAAFNLSNVDFEKDGWGQSTVAAYKKGLVACPQPLFLAQLCDRTELTMDWFYRNKTKGLPDKVLRRLEWGRVRVRVESSAPKRGPKPAASRKTA